MALERVREAVFEPSDKKIKKQVRQNQREIDREIRNLNREIKKNEKEQAKLKANIRKEAQAGNNVSFWLGPVALWFPVFI